MVTAKVVAECIGLDVTTVRRWSRLGVLPFVPVGSRREYNLDAVARTLNRGIETDPPKLVARRRRRPNGRARRKS